MHLRGITSFNDIRIKSKIYKTVQTIQHVFNKSQRFAANRWRVTKLFLTTKQTTKDANRWRVTELFNDEADDQRRANAVKCFQAVTKI